MPPLKNSRHERFARGLVEGLSAVDAYEKAGYERNRSSASKLQTNANIKGRIRELQDEAAEKATVTASRVLVEIARIAFADLGEAVTWGPDGVRLKDSTQLPLAVRAAVQEVTETTTQFGGSLKIKFHSKMQALDALAKHLRLYAEVPEDANEQARAIAALVQTMMGLTHGGFLPAEGLDSVQEEDSGTDRVGDE